MKIYNNTEYTYEVLTARPALGCYKDNWRQRTVILYPWNDRELVSVGVTFDRSKTIIAIEEIKFFARPLDAWKYGRSYTAE